MSPRPFGLRFFGFETRFRLSDDNVSDASLFAGHLANDGLRHQCSEHRTPRGERAMPRAVLDAPGRRMTMR